MRCTRVTRTGCRRFGATSTGGSRRRHNPFLEHATMNLWIASIRTGATIGADCRRSRIGCTTRCTTSGRPGLASSKRRSARPRRALSRRCRAAGGRARAARPSAGRSNPSLNESAGLLIDGFDEDPYRADAVQPAGVRRVRRGAPAIAKVKDLLAWAHRPDRAARRADRTTGRSCRPGGTASPSGRSTSASSSAISQSCSRSIVGVARQLGIRAADRRRNPAAGRRAPADSRSGRSCCLRRLAGRPVGCAVAIPDVNQVLEAHGRPAVALRPAPLPAPARDHRLRSRVLLLGVVPDVRRIGLYPLLIAEIYRRGRSERLPARRAVVDARGQRRDQRRHRGGRRPALQDVPAV